ncbi:sugar transport ATP-binding protein, partial [Listeria monocytogenes FSL F2-208]
YGTPYPNFTQFRIRDSCLKLLVGEIPKPLVFKIILERKKIKEWQIGIEI